MKKIIIALAAIAVLSTPVYAASMKKMERMKAMISNQMKVNKGNAELIALLTEMRAMIERNAGSKTAQ